MRRLLFPFSILYGIVVIIRNKLFDWGILKTSTFQIPVIAIGNITVGGTGKTPHTEFLIRLISPTQKLAVLSRGYGRKTRGFAEVTLHSNSQQVGDEPLQMKLKFPDVTVAVDEKRKHGIETLLASPAAPEVILLDDAYQHRYVTPNWNILLTDYHRLISHDTMLPAGNLREPAYGKKRSHTLIVTKCPANINEQETEKIKRKLKIQNNQQLFFSTYKYGAPLPITFKKEPLNIQLKNATVLAVTGIANPKPFYEHLLRLGIHELVTSEFPDHHNFTDSELDNIRKQYLSITNKNKCIITTEKDAVRLQSLINPKLFGEIPFFYIPIEVLFLADGEKQFQYTLNQLLKRENPFKI